MVRRRSYRRQRKRNYRKRSRLDRALRRPGVQIAILLIVALLVFINTTVGNEQARTESGMNEWQNTGYSFVSGT